MKKRKRLEKLRLTENIYTIVERRGRNRKQNQLIS